MEIVGELAIGMVATPIVGTIDEIKGQGINGDIRLATDISSLRDALSNFDYSATFDTNSKINYSSVDSRFVITDSDFNYITDRYVHNWYDDYAGDIYSDGTNTSVDYHNSLSNDKWSTRDIIESISNEDFESGYAFLQPNSINLQGIASYFNDHSNYSYDDIQTLVETSP